MSEPDLLERTRMALAEAGYPDADVQWEDDCLTVDGSIPQEAAWRAMELAWSSVTNRHTCCQSCSAVASDAGVDGRSIYLACLADRPLVRDCGLPR